MISIGQLSKLTGIKVPTIRYYEEIGLVKAPTRNAGNQRRYGDNAIKQLIFIKHARELGFSTKHIRILAQHSKHYNEPCNTATKLAKEQLKIIQQKIKILTQIEKELERISTGCTPDNAETTCYVFESLSDHSMCIGEHSEE